MSKIRKYKLTWRPPESEQIIGYKLYWSKKNRVTYDCAYIELGKVNEVCLPDDLGDIPQSGEPIILGITAMDSKGNESDIITLAEPYQVKVPLAPQSFSLTSIDEYDVIEADKQTLSQNQKMAALETPINDEENDFYLEDLPTDEETSRKKVKYYNDLGYRKFPLDE